MVAFPERDVPVVVLPRITAELEPFGVDPESGLVPCLVDLLGQILRQIVGTPGSDIPWMEARQNARRHRVESLHGGDVLAHVHVPPPQMILRDLVVAGTVGEFGGNPYLNPGIMDALQPPEVPLTVASVCQRFIHLDQDAFRPCAFDDIAIRQAPAVVISIRAELIGKAPRGDVLTIRLIHGHGFRGHRIVVFRIKDEPLESEGAGLGINGCSLGIHLIPLGIITQSRDVPHHGAERLMITEPVADAPVSEIVQHSGADQRGESALIEGRGKRILHTMDPNIGDAEFVVEIIDLVLVVVLEVRRPPHEMALGLPPSAASDISGAVTHTNAIDVPCPVVRP